MKKIRDPNHYEKYLYEEFKKFQKSRKHYHSYTEKIIKQDDERIEKAANENNWQISLNVMYFHRLWESITAQRALNRVKEACAKKGHHVAPTDIKWDKWSYGGAMCIVCGKHLGWYCPDSPTKTCDYPDHPPYDDGCIYCGLPSERK